MELLRDMNRCPRPVSTELLRDMNRCRSPARWTIAPGRTSDGPRFVRSGALTDLLPGSNRGDKHEIPANPLTGRGTCGTPRSWKLFLAPRRRRRSPSGRGPGDRVAPHPATAPLSQKDAGQTPGRTPSQAVASQAQRLQNSVKGWHPAALFVFARSRRHGGCRPAAVQPCRTVLPVPCTGILAFLPHCRGLAGRSGPDVVSAGAG